MPLADIFVRSFSNINDLQSFIQNDEGITEVIEVFQDNSGQYVIVFKGDYSEEED
jgi:hypothetical protein